MDPTSFLPRFDERLFGFWEYWSSLPRQGSAPHLRDYLDHVPPNLQPSVIIVDYYSHDKSDLRLIGTLMSELMGDDHDEADDGDKATQVYSGALRHAAQRMSWTAANHPCAYAAKHPIRSRGGRTAIVAGVAAPLVTDRPGCKTLVTYTNLAPLIDSLATDDHVRSVESLTPPIWLDIGYGVPAAVSGHVR